MDRVGDAAAAADVGAVERLYREEGARLRWALLAYAATR
jgi:hypothetical protein